MRGKGEDLRADAGELDGIECAVEGLDVDLPISLDVEDELDVAVVSQETEDVRKQRDRSFARKLQSLPPARVQPLQLVPREGLGLVLDPCREHCRNVGSSREPIIVHEKELKVLGNAHVGLEGVDGAEEE